MIVEPVPDHELQAYLDGELPRERMAEIEAYLSADAEAATAMMADMRSWNEVRLAYGSSGENAPSGSIAAARRLERGLARQLWLRRLRRGAAVMALIGSGWLAHATLGPWIISGVSAFSLPPAYVDDAVRAYQATEVRLAMASQVETRDLDASEIRATTEIIVPDLPESWEIEDVQVFPSSQGPSLQLAIRADGLGLVTLFAVRSNTAAIVAPTVTPREQFTTAHWQTGHLSYALVFKGGGVPLEAAVKALAAHPSLSGTH